MTERPGRVAITHRQAAREHTAAQAMAREAKCPIQEQVFHAGAVHHTCEYHRFVADASQLAAARKLRLGGTGGQLPPGYFGNSQIPDPLAMQVEHIIPQPELLRTELPEIQSQPPARYLGAIRETLSSEETPDRPCGPRE